MDTVPPIMKNSYVAVRGEILQTARDAYAQAKAEIADDIKAMKASFVSPPASEQEIRMQCLSLVCGAASSISMARSTKDTIYEADLLASYVLNGKKPEEA